MKTYNLVGKDIGIEVKANSKEEAIEKAEEILLQGLGGYVECIDMIYKVVRECFDPKLNVAPYEEIIEKEFKTYEEAWSYAEILAEEEVNDLNEDCEDGISFGIAEGDEDYLHNKTIKVQCYCENDDNTEEVTHYRIEEMDISSERKW